MPRFRITIGFLMVLVVIAAAALGALRYVRRESEFERWRRSAANWNPIGGNITQKRGSRYTVFIGQPAPLDFDYSVAFSRPLPPPEMAFPIEIDAWIEDVTTGQAVDMYRADLVLKAGRVESARGNCPWSPIFPRTGRYRVEYHIRYFQPDGRMLGGRGGGMGVQAIAPESLNLPAGH